MNEVIKQQWLAALRSGEYDQGRDRLRTDDGAFCCLGVLCDLHANATGSKWDSVDEDASYLGSETALPPAVQLWAELDSEDGGKVRIGGDEPVWLAAHNDGDLTRAKRTFLEIADAIEVQL